MNPLGPGPGTLTPMNPQPSKPLNLEQMPRVVTEDRRRGAPSAPFGAELNLLRPPRALGHQAWGHPRLYRNNGEENGNHDSISGLWKLPFRV